MEDKKSLNNKYQKIDTDNDAPVKEAKISAPEKEKKVNEKKIKEPKAKKEKAQKPPKEKKVKEPKKPKEKKIKEPKPPKAKKEKKQKNAEAVAPEVKDEAVKEIVSPQENIEIKAETEPQVREDGRKAEEIVLPTVKSVKKIKPKKEKKVKEKKTKEPKPPKPKKEKAEKAPKVKKEKVQKPPKEKKPREPITKKDIVTIAFAVLALAMVIGFAVIKFVPDSDIRTEPTESTTKPTGDKLSGIQVVRDGVALNLIQSDIEDVFYGFSSDYKLQYYQYKDNKMVAVQSIGTVNTSVDLGNETIPVTIDYVELGGKLFGIGLFVAEKDSDVYFYDMVTFRLVNLPKSFEQEGKALLLATTSKNALTQKISLWPESFVIDLNSGKTSRFLSVINRSIDITTGAGADDFCILTNEGCTATGNVPFITAREYEADSGKQDIFVKSGKKEELFASDVYGKYLLTDGNSVIFMKKTDGGFDVIRKTGEEEKTVFSLFGTMGSDYLYTGDYIFNKNDGKLYNLKTGAAKLIVGYRMSPEMMAVSPDGKYLVMLGTVVNMMDYQVHIFNLETGEYAKYEDENYSSHSNLTFINNSTAVYMVLDPNQGYEYVVLDVTKSK